MSSLGWNLMHRHDFSCSLMHLLKFFKNTPEYLTRGTAQMFITLMKFLQYSLVSSSFLLFNFFFHLVLFDGICYQYSQVLVIFLFYIDSDFFLDLVVLFLPSFVIFPFSFLAFHIFLYQLPFLYPDCIFCMYKSFKFFFSFGKQFDVIYAH